MISVKPTNRNKHRSKHLTEYCHWASAEGKKGEKKKTGVGGGGGGGLSKRHGIAICFRWLLCMSVELAISVCELDKAQTFASGRTCLFLFR